MSSTFKLAAQNCGLTIAEAAAFLDVRQDSATSWWLGRRGCNQGIIAELLQLAQKQEAAAQQAVRATVVQVDENGMPAQIELGLASDDDEARALGWPSVGAHAAVLRRVIDGLPQPLAVRVKVVPRGSTPSTAAGADAHGK